MALGYLEKRLKALDILQLPQPPYENLSISVVLAGLKTMKLPQCCDVRRGEGVVRHTESQSCEGLKFPLKAKIQEFENRFAPGSITYSDEFSFGNGWPA